MRVPRNFGWAARRTREVLADEGAAGVRRRSVSYLRRRRAAGPGPLQRLPMDDARPHPWPRSIVMIADTEPRQCYHYRVEQKIQACRHLGIPFQVVGPASATTVASAVQLASIVIVFRQSPQPGLLAGLDQCRRLGLPVVFEADDAVHDRAVVAANPNLDTVPGTLRRQVVSGTDGYRDMLTRADHVLASTPRLAAELGRNVPGRAFVMENGIDDGMLEIAEGIRRDPAPPPREPDTIVIGYGSGSRAHDSDLAVAAAGLADVLAEDPAVRLHLMGPVRIPPELVRFADRIKRTPELVYGEYLRQLASCDLTIAPLVDLPFNYYKSQVKVLEAAVVGVPLIASPVVYRDYVVPGRTALLADDHQWAEQVRRLVADSGLREQLTTAARAHLSDSLVDRRPARQLAEMVTALS